MPNILLQIYNGEIHPRSTYSERFPSHREKRLTCTRHHKHFLERLQAVDPALYDEMLELLDEQLYTDMLELPEAFAEGFCMGAKIILEVLRLES